MSLAVRRLTFTILPLIAVVVSLTLAAGATAAGAEEEKQPADSDRPTDTGQPGVRAFVDKVAEKTKD
ncbi:MAG: hypothetical protein RDV41_13460, partial [Planctomycetota bacterium]|nr:hypothetical protein [Planctomycetota bacterium]